MARKHMADDRKVQLCFWNSNKFLLWKFFGKPAWKGSCHRCFWNVFISLLETRNPTTIVKLFGYYIYIYMDVFVLSKNIINMYTVFCYKRFSFTWNGIRHPKWFLWMENWGYFGSSLNLGKQSNLHGYLLWFTLPCLCACHACNGATQHRWQRVVSKSHCMVVRVLQTKNKTVGTWVFHLYIYICMPSWQTRCAPSLLWHDLWFNLSRKNRKSLYMSRRACMQHVVSTWHCEKLGRREPADMHSAPCLFEQKLQRKNHDKDCAFFLFSRLRKTIFWNMVKELGHREPAHMPSAPIHF